MKRHYFYYFLFLLSFGLHAQSNGFVKAGKPIVIGKGVKITNKEVAYALSGLTRYRGLETVWLYKIPLDQLDTILQRVDRDIHPQRLIIENCQLSDLPELIATRLHSLEILQGNNTDLVALCSSLKRVPIKQLTFFSSTTAIDTDSLGLLDSLESLKLTNLPNATKVNGRVPFYISNNGKTRSIQLVYCGKLTADQEETTLLEANQIRYKSEFTAIKQPVSSVRINDTVVVFESTQPIAFDYQSGSNIHITPNAFIYSDGRPYKGIAIVSYREFRDEIDIALSGIPMTIDVNGEQKLFRSGGMYEISARDTEGRPLMTKNDSCVQVNYATSDTASDFAIYQLNNQQWIKTTQPVVTKKRPRVDSLSAAEAAFYSNMARRITLTDTTVFHDRFPTTRYFYIYDSVWFRSIGPKKMIASRAQQGIQLTNKGRLKDHRRLIRIENDFALTDWNMPYLRPFVNRLYVVQDGKDRSAIRQLSKSGIVDARIDQQGDELVLTLKTVKGFDTLRITAMKSYRHGKKEENYQLHTQLMKRYNRILAHTAKKFDRQRRFSRNGFTRFSAASYNQNRRLPDSMLYEAAYQKALPLMTPEEKRMGRKGFYEAVVSKLKALSYHNFGIASLNNVLVKSGMGISNIDGYLHAGQMQPVYAKVQQAPTDSSDVDASVVVFRDIKTSSPVQLIDRHFYEGYRFYKGENYLVQFSDDRYMTVYKLESTPTTKSRPLSFAKSPPIDIYGMTSDEVKRLIYQQ
jgi:hypothetical protein